MDYLYSILPTQEDTVNLSDSDVDDDAEENGIQLDVTPLIVSNSPKDSSMLDNSEIKSRILTLHKDFNITRQIRHLQNCNHVFAKLSFEEKKSEVHTRAQYLNQLVATEKKTENFTRQNIALIEDDEDDFGFFTASGLVDTPQQKKKDRAYSAVKASDIEEDIHYEEVELEFITVFELYNPYGVLLHEHLSDMDYKDWWKKLKEQRRKKAQSGLNNPPQIPMKIHKNLQSVKFFRSTEIVEDVKQRGKKIVACLQQPLKAEIQQASDLEALFLSSTAAHNEGVYYILMYAVFPNLEQQLAQSRTRISNKKVSLVKKVARTDKFVTSIVINNKGKEDELCRYTSSITCFTDDFVGKREPRDPLQLVGMFYYTSESDIWSFRATNDFGLTPPAKLVIQVAEAKKLAYLTSKADEPIPTLVTDDNDIEFVSPSVLNRAAKTISVSNVESVLKQDASFSVTRSDGMEGGLLSLIQPHSGLDEKSKIDTFCAVTYGKQRERSKTIHKSQNPAYPEEFRFDLSSEDLPVKIDILQAFAITNDIIATVTLPNLTEIFGNDQQYRFEMRKPKIQKPSKKIKRRSDVSASSPDERPVLIHDQWYSLTPTNSEKEKGVAKVRLCVSLEW